VTQERIYLDHAATAPLRREALEAMLPYLRHGAYNPSSLHAEGRRARRAIDEARGRIAGILGAKHKEIAFTASGSEADALAIVGTARLHPRARLVSCAIEHEAVLRNLAALSPAGYTVTVLPVDENGCVDEERFEAALRERTALASIMLANNEIGTIEPVARLAAIARRHNVSFHTDAVQAAGWLDLNVDALGVEMMSLSAHKFGGPHGVGILYVREGTAIVPLVQGGGQEAGRRSGTEDVAGIVGTAAALEIAQAERAAAAPRIAALRDAFERSARETIPGTRVNGAGPERLPNVSSLSFEGVTAETLAIRLDLEGVAVSPGSACTSGVAEGSHVIAALGIGDPRGAVRFSLGSSTTEVEIERVVSLLPSVVRAVRQGE
jgi:cysteine desulfurase